MVEKKEGGRSPTSRIGACAGLRSHSKRLLEGLKKQ